MKDDMQLPEGKTCADCRWFERCRALIGPRHIHDEQQRCDFAPSRFRLRTTPRAAETHRGTNY